MRERRAPVLITEEAVGIWHGAVRGVWTALGDVPWADDVGLGGAMLILAALD